MTIHSKKTKLKKQFQKNHTSDTLKITSETLDKPLHNELYKYIDQIHCKKQDLTKRTLIIIPGYSISNPPKIGDHRFYINALKYHSKLNPNGYKRIYVFDIYSKKDGRCNFKHSIPELADELYKSINTHRDNWQFKINGEIDFIGASMGGLIVRKFIQDYLIEKNKISTNNWGKLHIKNIILIATPNHGCLIIDKLQMPIIQLLLKLLYGKNNFSQSKQFKQIAKGKVSLHRKPINLLLPRTTSSNSFLEELNSECQVSKSIRWITISGSKRKWYSVFLYDKNEENDGVVLTSSVTLKGAENITDKKLEMDISWNHRDLYQAESLCKLLHGLLTFNLTLNDYLKLNRLLKTQQLLDYNQKGFKYIFNRILLKPQSYLNH